MYINIPKMNLNYIKLILILYVKIITINIFYSTISLGVTYTVKEEDLSSLFNQNHDTFQAFEDLGIVNYIDYGALFPRIVEKANKELIDDKRFISPIEKTISFNSSAFKIIEAGGGGDCFFYSIAKGLKLKQYDKDTAITSEYFNHRELRKILAKNYQEIAKGEKINSLDYYDEKIQVVIKDRYTKLYQFPTKIYEDFKLLLEDEAKTDKISNDNPLLYAKNFENGHQNTMHNPQNIMLLLEEQNVSYAYFASYIERGLTKNTYNLLAYKKIADKPLIFVYFNGVNHYTTLALYDEIIPEVKLNDIKIEDVEKRVLFSTLDLIQSDGVFMKNLSQALFEIIQKDSSFAKDFVDKTKKQKGLDEYFTQLFTDVTSSVKDNAFRFMHNKAINIVQHNIRSNNNLAAVSAGSNEDKNKINLWWQILIGRDYFIRDTINHTSSTGAVIGGIDCNINKNLLVGGFLSLNNFSVDNKIKAENIKNIIGGIYSDFVFTSNLSLSAVFGGSRIISKIQESESQLGYFADARFKCKLKVSNKVQLIPNIGYRINKNCDFLDNFSYKVTKIHPATSHNLLLGLNLIMDNFKLGKVNISSEIHALKEFELYNSGRTIQTTIGQIFLPSIATNSKVSADTMSVGALVMVDLGAFKITVGADWMIGEKYNGWLAKLNMSLEI